ncbi:helix-turn-helix transcriptional regulator [Wenzhouxiangella marina]|uniref:Uncharacterized protein n=1 Tax=Wenzhouxiangella marina TaxID=1579979 RepID=A0A0K0XWJ0_9GAMM|nr:LuxR C-terminal-related transcriptional regulator [Wenzhouxiangella marina]AKS41981.1 hypothetical protein WM2015_1611 [Wenzhouxiangella marina]MBB6086252.1 DNA-binding CsgD family transcriptional regulator [Wenzhouxiangella marina]
MTQDLHTELQSLLQAESSDRALNDLLKALRQRPVAGVCGFSYPLERHAAHEVKVHWAQDLSGELEALSVEDFAQQGFDNTPAWLLRWALTRAQPFHLRRYSRYLPFSTVIILRSTKPPDGRGLKDLIAVPYPHAPRGLGALIGLFEPIPDSVVRELVLLTTACLARQPWGIEAEHRSVLSERQLECLQWIVAGKSLEDTARIIGMSYSNVRYHLERAKEQTGLHSLQQLVAFAAVEYGLSPFGPERPPDESDQPRRARG